MKIYRPSIKNLLAFYSFFVVLFAGLSLLDKGGVRISTLGIFLALFTAIAIALYFFIYRVRVLISGGLISKYFNPFGSLRLGEKRVAISEITEISLGIPIEKSGGDTPVAAINVVGKSSSFSLGVDQFSTKDFSDMFGTILSQNTTIRTDEFIQKLLAGKSDSKIYAKTALKLFLRYASFAFIVLGILLFIALIRYFATR